VMVDTPLADMSRGRRPWSVAPSWLAHLLGAQMADFQGVVAGDGPDQLAVVEDLQQGWFDPGDHGLTGQVPANRQPLVGDPDAAVAANDPGHHGGAGRRWLWVGGPRGRRGRRWWSGTVGTEPLGWSGHAKRLVWAKGVVAGDPVVQHLLSFGQALEALAGEQLGPKRLVEAFDLAGGGRAADPGTQVGDALLAADAVEQHLGRVRAEPAGEHLPLSVRTSSGIPYCSRAAL
jgi:hypothetical protein